MKINVIREPKTGEVVMMKFNRTTQIWDTTAEAIKSAKELADDSNPFEATICPITIEEAQKMCDANRVNYCGAKI
jgi:hypothetical protein